MALQPQPSNRGEAGFTLAELSVSLLVTVIMILGVLALFDFSSRVARVQTNVSDMQQALRVSVYDTVRTVRMAGRGGMPLGNPPTGLAVSVRDNVVGAQIGGPLTPGVVDGTDVLAVRGAFSSPLFQVNSADPASFKLPAGVTPGEIWIADTTPTGIAQDVTALRYAVTNNIPEALIMTSPRDTTLYAVVELDVANSIVGGAGPYKIAFRSAGGIRAAAYAALSPGGAFPGALTNIAYVGILEEYRYYVRDAHAIPNDNTSLPMPKFSRARVFPGTDVVWRSADDVSPDKDHQNWKNDIADNVLDFQTAMAFDTLRGGGSMTQDDNDDGDDDRIFESADGKNDDWLFNDNDPVVPALWLNVPLYYLRLSLLVRTDRRDTKYVAPTIQVIENHDVSASALNSTSERKYHRRLLQTMVDMRNLG